MMMTWLKKYFFLCLLVIFSFLFFYFKLYNYLTLDTLRTYQSVVEAWADIHYFKAVFIYISLFTLLIACAIPCATFFSLLGGFLFGLIAILYAEIATTLGGFLLYFAVRLAIGTPLIKQQKGWIK